MGIVDYKNKIREKRNYIIKRYFCRQQSLFVQVLVDNDKEKKEYIF